MSIFDHLEKRIETELRKALNKVLGPVGAPELFELLDYLIEDLKQRCISVGGESRFPFRYVAVQIGIAQGQLKTSIPEILSNRVYLANEIRGALEETGFECPRPLRVDVGIVDAASIRDQAKGFDCACSEQLPEPPVLTLTVREGDIDGKTFVLQQRFICVGRGHEVRDNSGRLIRRNLVVFPDSAVSRTHAHIQFDDEAAAYRLFDDGSSLETTIYREAGAFQVPSGSSGGAWLRSGDVVHFGPVQLSINIAELPL